MYTKEYFIEKFTAIHDENWIGNGSFTDDTKPERGCALYHCGTGRSGKNNEESIALIELFDTNLEKIKATNPFLKDMFDKFYDKWITDIDGDTDTQEKKQWIVYSINDLSYKFNSNPKKAILDCLHSI